MPKKLVVATVMVVVFLIVFWVFLLTPDAPGYWVPSPVGSGWCVAHGIVGVKDGTRAHCPIPEK